MEGELWEGAGCEKEGEWGLRLRAGRYVTKNKNSLRRLELESLNGLCNSLH